MPLSFFGLWYAAAASFHAAFAWILYRLLSPRLDMPAALFIALLAGGVAAGAAVSFLAMALERA